MRNNQLLEIMKCILNCTCDELFAISKSDWNEIVSLARKHNVVCAVAYWVDFLPEEMQPDLKMRSDLKKTLGFEVAKSTNQLYAADELQKYFEEHQLYNITLKGINTKQRYPQEWIRTMGDLDILYQPSQQKQVRAAMEALGYRDFQEGRKHDHYSRPPFVSVEMHRELVAASSEFSGYYEDIWERCKEKAGCTYTYEMSLEDEYIFNIIHLSEHFKEGGVGIRFIMDIYVYNHLDMNWDYLEAELRKIGVWEFY